MGSGSSSADRLSKEEASALNTAVTEAPGLKQKLQNLEAEATESKEEVTKLRELHELEVAKLRRKIQQLEEAQKSSVNEVSEQSSNAQGCQAEASEAVSGDKAKSTDVTEDAEDEKTLEADKAAAAKCYDDLHEAARGGSVPALRHLLRQNPERLEEEDHLNGMRPLHFAAEFGHTDVAELLLARGAELEAKGGRYGWTPLHYAAEQGHLLMVERLIVAGAAVDAAEEDGTTPLHRAARDGHLQVAERLIAAGAEVDAASKGGCGLGGPTGFRSSCRRPLKGTTPLHRAAWEGHLQVVERLIAAGAAMDAVDNEGDTPYDVAKMFDRVEVMARLETVIVVSVTLLSGRECSCKLSENESISDLKKTAERELEIEIQGLVNSDGETLNESHSLRKANVKASDTLTAVV